MKTVVLVPRRADGGHRDKLWRWVQERWATEHPDLAVHEGHHHLGPFNRSAAVNAAAKRAAPDWELAVIADADCFVGPAQLQAALHTATQGCITFAFDRFCYLSRKGTTTIMDGYLGMWEPFVEWALPGTCSSMVVVTRQLWEAVGGMDEGFIGWGMEDVAFSLACQAMGEGCARVEGPVWHLYHPPSPENAHTPDFERNVDRLELYRTAQVGSRGDMAWLLKRLGKIE